MLILGLLVLTLGKKDLLKLKRQGSWDDSITPLKRVVRWTADIQGNQVAFYIISWIGILIAILPYLVLFEPVGEVPWRSYGFGIALDADGLMDVGLGYSGVSAMVSGTWYTLKY